MRERTEGMQERWITCAVRPGYFSDECVVHVGDHYWIVPRHTVRNIEGERGELRVHIFPYNGSDWAMLPTDYSDSIPLSSCA